MTAENLSIGEKIRHLRKNLNLTQSDLAGNEFTSSYISLIEKGRVNPSLKALNTIATKLNKPINYFLTDQEDNNIGLSFNHQQNKQLTTLIYLGESLITKNNLEQAQKYFQKAKDLSVEKKKGIIDKNLGLIAFKQKKYDSAFKYFNNALEFFKAEKNYQELAWIYNALGVVMQRTRQHSNCLDYYLSALNILEEKKIDNPNLKLKIFFNLGDTYSRLGQLKNADNYLKMALPLIDAYGNLNQISKLYMSLGINYYEMGDLDQALKYSHMSMELSKTVENMELVAGLKTNLGMVYTQLGRYSEAESFLEESLKLKDNLNIEEKKSATIIEIARLNFYRNRLDCSLKYCNQGLKLLKKYPDPLEKGKAYHLIGLIKQQMYKQLTEKNITKKAEEYFAAANEAFQQAIELFESLDEKRYLADVYAMIADLYSKIDTSKANQYYKKSVDLFQEIN